jgi:hypothetical protein
MQSGFFLQKDFYLHNNLYYFFFIFLPDVTLTPEKEKIEALRRFFYEQLQIYRGFQPVVNGFSCKLPERCRR